MLSIFGGMFISINQIGSYTFRNQSILQDALRHPSSGPNPNFQRLEFMGDSVLSIVISDTLMEMFPHESEGALSKRRASLVSRYTCQSVGECLGLKERVLVGMNVDLVNSSIIADAVEAIIGAIYIDSVKDMSVCMKWIIEQWAPYISSNSPNSTNPSPPSDPKTALQEWTQSHKLSPPVYNELRRTGPDHNLTIHMSVEIPLFHLSPENGEGRTKKAAEKQAASAMLDKIQEWQSTYQHASHVVQNAARNLYCF